MKTSSMRANCASAPDVSPSARCCSADAKIASLSREAIRQRLFDAMSESSRASIDRAAPVSPAASSIAKLGRGAGRGEEADCRISESKRARALRAAMLSTGGSIAAEQRVQTGELGLKNSRGVARRVAGRLVEKAPSIVPTITLDERLHSIQNKSRRLWGVPNAADCSSSSAEPL